MRVSLIVPVLESEPQLQETLRGLAALRRSLDVEIVVVVDVPDPARLDAARASNDPPGASVGATVLYRAGERGFGSAIRHGFARANGNTLVPVMADGSEDPEDVVRLVRELERGWDVVGGARYATGGRVIGDSAKQRLSRWYSVLMRAVGGPPIHDVSNSFKAYRREVVEAVNTVAQSFDLSVELAVKADQAGFRVGEVPTTWTTRRLGTSNFRMLREVPHYARWLLLAARRPRIGRRRAPGALPRPPLHPGGRG